MRRAEVARAGVEHLDLEGGNCLVPITKTGGFRVGPLSLEGMRALALYLCKHS
jgi:integrase